ncbi:conserved Plasmodium protein, unknown function [Plasmodium knowlesi strain H]|uniref:Uncharacterized protein n=3 Tax=Plasmodium knowlesi TaxID=5850 RepID=A0A5K1V445_PLAKH|nr:conserved Plasmodium protein, unknown function [Plasmodium knowlesi strain H]OTN63685.1 Uncharacterized protein PKNOH_S140229200 [Plasmodium knowlesi]CAA9990719.1 conserved Plasmodium protein, unknown function [Plasmodium knowlesi strain H]SBO25872.1 conserved Plasmodium protein, unknown function [Plasmodium knowlesi strain H]SBO28638.1 conserved Plasmodium protein, unknown function [Plasmodium knowlesi strain H]VVS80193.1 conserved Plasmodium protein, unknown function [Plasmodium knowlesi |eukprot:XP_002262009.1 hypothetical protein, conserved in Plasmodium species [Plasmodium knowlesi strain H]
MIVNHDNHDKEYSAEISEEKREDESCQISESALCPRNRDNGGAGLLGTIHNGEELHDGRKNFVGEKCNMFGEGRSQHVEDINSDNSQEESKKNEREQAQRSDTNEDSGNSDRRKVTPNELSKQEYCEGAVDRTQACGAVQSDKRFISDYTIKGDSGGGAESELQIEVAHVPRSDAAGAVEIEEDDLQEETEDGSLSGTLYGSIVGSLNSSQVGSHNDVLSSSLRNNPDGGEDETVEAVVAKEEMINITGLYHRGINKIEAVIALYKYYRNNFNQRFREQMNKYNPLIYFYSNNNFENHISVDYINYRDKMNAIKTERLSRLVLYIEDINKIKQALKVKQHNELKLEDDGKKEYFYDANEDIEDFFIFDNTVSYLNNDVESIFSEGENSSFLKDDASIDNFLEEQKNKTGDEYNMLNLFNRFSLKNYYMFDINKNLCAIYARTPMIIKRFAEKINSYSNAEKPDADLDDTEQDGGNFPGERGIEENGNYYPAARSRENNQNLDAYIQFHCEKWQENMYDIVEVNSLEFDFNRLRCNIM